MQLQHFFVWFAVTALADEDLETLSLAKLERLFQKMDMDGDGSLTQPEINDFAKSMRHDEMVKLSNATFTYYDGDKDDKVTLQETKDASGATAADSSFMTSMNAIKFKAADKDENGFLDRRELEIYIHPASDPAAEDAVAAAEFKHKDMDNNGKLSIGEFFGIKGEEPGQGYKQEFNNLDTDQDGMLDVNEIKTFEFGMYYTEKAMAEVLKKADKDKDGRLVLGELLASADAIRSHEASLHLEQWSDRLDEL